MENVYEAHAPKDFPSPKDQPKIGEQASTEEKKPLLMKETIDRWRKEILDRIQYLKENIDQANRDKDALSREIDRLKDELDGSRVQARAIEMKLNETLEIFNNLLDEVSLALQS